jgi:hypothetical protein
MNASTPLQQFLKWEKEIPTQLFLVNLLMANGKHGPISRPENEIRRCHRTFNHSTSRKEVT